MASPRVERLLRVLDDGHRNAGVGKAHGDAAAHGAGADHRGALDLGRLDVAQVRHLGGLAFGEENMPLRPRFLARDQVQEARALALEGGVDRQLDRVAQRLQGARRRDRAAQPPRRFGGERLELAWIALERRELLVAIARQCQRAFLGQHAARESDRRRGDITVGNFVHNSARERILGVDRIAGEDHRQRLLHSGEARQALGAAGAGHQAKLDFRQRDPRAWCRDAEVTAERHLEPAAHRRPEQRRHHRFAHLLDRRDHVDRGGSLRWLAELGNIRPGNERAAGAGQHQPFNRGILARPLKDRDQRGAQRIVERIHRWVVDPDNTDIAVKIEAGERHGQLHHQIAPHCRAQRHRFNPRRAVDTPPQRLDG